MAPSGLRRCVRDVTPYLLTVITIATLGPLQYGYHIAELNAPEDVITCRKKTISSTVALTSRHLMGSRELGESSQSSGLVDCIPMTPAEFATVSSCFTIGGLIGALAAGPFCSKRGRLSAMRLTALFYAMGAALETLSAGVSVMSIGRLLAGVGAGASTVIVPLYISEVSPPDERGFFGVFTQISINIGIVGTQTLGYFLSYGSAWRWVLGVGVLIAAAQGLGLLVVPESPAWLASQRGDVTRARQTLQRIRGQGFDIADEVHAWGGGADDLDDPDDLESEEQGLLASQANPVVAATVGSTPASKQTATHLGFVDVLRDPNTRPAIVAVVGIMFAQQLCGVNSIIMYSVSLLADLLPVNSAVLTIFISLINLATTIACSPLPDRLGRKTCLMVSIIGQGTSSLALALSILFGVKILSAVSVLFFVAFFAVGLGPVPFILASELVTQEAVGATQSWCLGANYIATFLVAQFFPIVNIALNRRFGGAGWVYFIFAALAAGSALFVSWWVPETKGKRDADEVWGRTRRLD